MNRNLLTKSSEASKSSSFEACILIRSYFLKLLSRLNSIHCYHLDRKKNRSSSLRVRRKSFRVSSHRSPQRPNGSAIHQHILWRLFSLADCVGRTNRRFFFRHCRGNKFNMINLVYAPHNVQHPPFFLFFQSFISSMHPTSGHSIVLDN